MLTAESGGAFAAIGCGVAGASILCLRTMLTAERARLAESRSFDKRRSADRAPFNDLR